MKRICKFLLLVVMCIANINVRAQQPKLTGHIKGLGNKPLVFGYLQKGDYKLDTVFATNDQFSYEPKSSDDGLISLHISRPRYTSFWYEVGTTTVTGAVDEPYKLSIEGGSENALLNQYHEVIEWPYEKRKQGVPDSIRTLISKQEQDDILTFVRQHPSSRTSAYLLYWQTLYDESLLDSYEQLFKTLSPQIQASYQGKEIAKRLVVLQNQPVVGKVAPNFTLSDTAGHAVSSNTYRGKYVLLDFWGHWCSPCIRSFPKLKELQKVYGAKLVIIGIAAEFASDKPQWIQAIRTNELSWIQVSELTSDKGAVNTQYNITAFPTYLLLNKEGVVIERALGIDKIEKKLATISQF